MADPDPELRMGGGVFCFACPAGISSFKIFGGWGGGGGGGWGLALLLDLLLLSF